MSFRSGLSGFLCLTACVAAMAQGPLEIQSLPPSARALPLPAALQVDATFLGIGNEDVLEMARAEFGDATIIAAILANETRFDVSARALLALKHGGVSEPVLEAMLAAESARRQAAAPPEALAPDEPLAAQPPVEAAQSAGPPQMSPDALAVLSQVIEQLALQSAATQMGAAEPGPEAPGDDADVDDAAGVVQAPRAWTVDGADKIMLTPTIAQVAFTDAKRFGSTPLKTLQGLAEKALAFANPALGMASGIGGLFRADDPVMTAVWALLGPSSSRRLGAGAAFEIDFGDIPGVNPDEYRPAIVQLVPTRDNYRLVGAAKTNESNLGGLPDGPIVEEPVAAQVTPLARGRYRVALHEHAAPGEYALVLRPIVVRDRERRRNTESSLGELMGGGSSHILYITWDFSVRRG